MKFTFKILYLLTTILMVGGYGFAQKNSENSRLTIGQNPKTSIFINNLVSPNSKLPKEIKLNNKPSFTQFYRDLIISNTSKNTLPKTVSQSTSQETSTEKLFKNEKITISNIYPNPANDFANLDYKIVGSFNSASVSFFNLLGTQIAEFDLQKNSDKLKIATTNWDTGIYMYQLVIDGKKIATKKLLVRHN